MMVPSVSNQLWRDLYQAACGFRDTQCWQWMPGFRIVGVQNPENREIGYYRILGTGGEVPGLVVHLVFGGLEEYKAFQPGDIFPDGDGATLAHNCLKLSFESRSRLSKTDLEVIKRLGLKFRGRNSWPKFRRFRPGYLPWYLTESEVRYLSVVLGQATEIALEALNEPQELTGPGENHRLVRVPSTKGDGWEWASQRVEPSSLAEAHAERKVRDELRLQRIRKKIPQRQGIWEADFFPSSILVEGDDRPFYPLTFLCAHQGSGFVFGPILVEPSERESEFPEKILEWIERHRFLPSELRVRRAELSRIIEPVVTPLGIRMRITKRLDAVDHAKASLFDFLS